MPRSLFDKIWESHLVDEQPDGTCLVYIDRHLVHELSSPQAFEALQAAGRVVRRTDATLAMADHNVPTIGRDRPIEEPQSRIQVDLLTKNCEAFGVEVFDVTDVRHGIVHVVGPEQGFTLPGATLACGDSHTSTHGALGCFALGIGTSDVEHLLATQTLMLRRPKNFRIAVEGRLPLGVTAKDIALAIIGRIGTAGATGCVIEFAGRVVRDLSIEGRMTVANMAIEAGARAGLIAPDDKTFAYLKGRPKAPTGALWDRALAYWRTLPSDPGATFDKEIAIDAATIAPLVTWGTSPEDVVPIDARVPRLDDMPNPDKRRAAERALAYMDLAPGMPMTAIKIDRVFIGSCTNGRIEDLREAAAVLRGRRVANHIQGIVVPGSGLVKRQAESEGLDKVFLAAGLEWRDAGCSACIGLNGDDIARGERCASTSNRNFEDRQGAGGRTHLMSPAMAAAAAVMGHLADVRALAAKPEN